MLQGKHYEFGTQMTLIRLIYEDNLTQKSILVPAMPDYFISFQIVRKMAKFFKTKKNDMLPPPHTPSKEGQYYVNDCRNPCRIETRYGWECCPTENVIFVNFYGIVKS